MPTYDELTVSEDEQSQAWRDLLLRRLEAENRVQAASDEADSHAMRVRIEAAGQATMSLDFVIRCMDSREIAIELSDAENPGQPHLSADERKERNDAMQGLVRDYFRDLQKRTQVSHDLTHSFEETKGLG